MGKKILKIATGPFQDILLKWEWDFVTNNAGKMGSPLQDPQRALIAINGIRGLTFRAKTLRDVWETLDPAFSIYYRQFANLLYFDLNFNTQCLLDNKNNKIPTIVIYACPKKVTSIVNVGRKRMSTQLKKNHFYLYKLGLWILIYTT